MTLGSRIAASLFAAAAAAVLAAAAFCSYAIAHGASARWRILFRVLCHGIESRCLELWGVSMPICARCTAIYAGLIVGIVLFVIVPSLRRRLVPSVVLALAIAPLAIDGLTQAFRFRESTNSLRVLTGMIAASAFALWAMSHIERGSRRSEEGTLS
ncbi:MAG TPA: DUF2085 domain-containing protein [Thermoanaerobaculia bacterium]